MCGAAHQHHGLDREGESADMDLRHISDDAGALLNRKIIERLAVEPHFASLGVDQAEQGFQQCGLAAAIRPEQRQHLAGFEGDIDAAADNVVGIADA